MAALGLLLALGVGWQRLPRLGDAGAGILGAPSVVLLERDPWLMVIGSDTPTFALYTKGTVIYQTPRQKRRRLGESPYVSAVLAREQRERLIALLGLDRLLNLNDNYETTSATDQPDNLLYLSTRGRTKKISVYGSFRQSREARSALPPALRKTLEGLIGYRNDRARPWLPPKIEVMIWDWSDATGPPAPWPRGWPDLNSRGTTTKRNGLHSLFLGSAHFRELEELAQRGRGQALLINGRKWSMSYRLPFPDEQRWMQ